jgi:regulator of replication initiation timing
LGNPRLSTVDKGEAMTIDGITTYVDNNPALVKEIERIERTCNKLIKENEELKIEVKVLERLLQRMSDRY